MKKKLLFISDFDGTMTLKDFYHLFTETHLKELDKELLGRYKRREITSFEYLAGILQSLNHTEDEIYNAIQSLPVDPMVKPVFDMISALGGDCVVLSAGADVYIRPILDRVGLNHVALFANRGVIENGGITMFPPENSNHFSPLYGISKEIIVKEFRDNYETIIFAGDGTADFHPARIADIRFAKSVCAFRLKKAEIEFNPFDTFTQINEVLTQKYFL